MVSTLEKQRLEQLKCDLFAQIKDYEERLRDEEYWKVHTDYDIGFIAGKLDAYKAILGRLSI